MREDKKRFYRYMLLILFAALVYCLAAKPDRVASAVSYVWSVFSCIIAGLCLAFILNLILAPVEKLVSRLFKKRPKPKTARGISLVITYILALGLVALVISSIVPSITDIVNTVAARLPGALEHMPDSFKQLADRLAISDETIEKLKAALENFGATLVSMLEDSLAGYANFAFNLTKGVFGGIVDVILTIALSVYVLADKEKISSAAEHITAAYLGPKSGAFYVEVRDLAGDKFSDFFRGQIIEAFILGVLCFIGMLIFRFPNAGAISVLVGVCAVVPVLGPWVGSVTSILLTLINNPVTGVLFAVYILILQQIEDNVIYPRIVGKTMNVPGILVLCAVIVGAEVGGMIGIIIAVPLSGVLFEMLKKRTRAKIEKKKENSEDRPEDKPGANPAQ